MGRKERLNAFQVAHKLQKHNWISSYLFKWCSIVKTFSIQCLIPPSLAAFLQLYSKVYQTKIYKYG